MRAEYLVSPDGLQKRDSTGKVVSGQWKDFIGETVFFSYVFKNGTVISTFGGLDVYYRDLEDTILRVTGKEVLHLPYYWGVTHALRRFRQK